MAKLVTNRLIIATRMLVQNACFIWDVLIFEIFAPRYAR